jgi:hypothetical protein
MNPLVSWQALRQALGQVAASWRGEASFARRGRKPLGDDVVSLRLPLPGTWYVASGGTTRATSHSWDILAQRYAYDFVVRAADGRTFRGSGRRLKAYHAFDRPVLAAGDGVVVSVRDGIRDYPHPSPSSLRLDWRTRDVRGNFVVIRHDRGIYSLTAHLREGSLCVKVGDRVHVGQVVGRCGNSGHSTEPHVHFHVQDSPSFYTGLGLPVRFLDLRVDGVPCDRAFVAAGHAVRTSDRSRHDRLDRRKVG